MTKDDLTKPTCPSQLAQISTMASLTHIFIKYKTYSENKTKTTVNVINNNRVNLFNIKNGMLEQLVKLQIVHIHHFTFIYSAMDTIASV